MRSRLRLHPITQLTLAATVFFFAGAACVRAQAPPLPKSWNDAVNQLAVKIASSVSPTTPIELTMENTSSLGAASVGAVELALKSALESHSFHLMAPGAIASKPPMRLTFTLSESAASYVWVVRVANDVAANADSFSPAIVSVAKSDISGSRSESEYVSLEKRLIWKQPQPILDFALVTRPSSAESALLVLDPSRFAVYEMSGSEWRISHTSPLPETALVSRDPSGEIDLRGNSFRVAGRECAGDPDLAGTIHCRAATNPEVLPVRDKLPGVPNGVGSGVGSFVSATCEGQAIFLGSGDRDWTQTDAIQAYLTAGSFASSNSGATASGSPVPFPGPVVSLHGGPDASSVRAVVHNLKTGDYEAYIVTATCSH